MKSELEIREIQKRDNGQVAQLIRATLEEYNVPKIGSAYEDTSLNDLHQAYNRDKASFYVLFKRERLVGCAGVAPLENYQGNVCELQKMYVAPVFRGKGYGRQMVAHCLARAQKLGFEGCYLETMPNMHVAKGLYTKLGFKFIDAPMGFTGHHACHVYMYKSL
ncbi:MAG: GNAT family N-acetyltransferase [Bacteroidota bacterium]